MQSSLRKYRKRLQDKKAELRLLETQLSKLNEEKEALLEELKVKKEAHKIIQSAAELTQKSLEDNLSSVVSLALRTVFEDQQCDFVVEFVSRRGTTECDLLFDVDGERINPLYDSGFGLADIASIALRVAYWSAGDTRPILIIDEPCKNLSEAYHSVAGRFFKELCNNLGLQIIMVTHINELKKEADNLIEVDMENEVSYVIT